MNHSRGYTYILAAGGTIQYGIQSASGNFDLFFFDSAGLVAYRADPPPPPPPPPPPHPPPPPPPRPPAATAAAGRESAGPVAAPEPVGRSLYPEGGPRARPWPGTCTSSAPRAAGSPRWSAGSTSGWSARGSTRSP